MRNEIDAIKKNRVEGEKPQTSMDGTVFDSILDSDLPEREKETERLWQEAQVICIAGTETTAWALSVITFHLLSNHQVLQTLRDEFESAMPESSQSVDTKELEKLTYLVSTTNREQNRDSGRPGLILRPDSRHTRGSSAGFWC